MHIEHLPVYGRVSEKGGDREKVGIMYGSCTLWVVVVPVNRKDRDTDVEVGVFVVYCGEAGEQVSVWLG